MKVDITTKNIDINPEHKAYTEEKIMSLGKYAGSFGDDSAKAQVEIKRNGDKDYHEQIEVHVQVHVAGGNAQTAVLAGEVEEGVNLAYEKVKAQLLKHKGTHQSSKEKLDVEDIDTADLGTVNPEEAI